EMWVMYIEMDMARRNGTTLLHVKSVSKTLDDIVTGNCNVNRKIPTLVQHICALKNMD
ncbi:hypothetical protein A2U01_0076367, partial [Trifolium medium]|nr:hypothetical protein [Trifolium medium]